MPFSKPADGATTGLLRNALLLSALIFLLLEIWRPCFFLTDDNLSGGWPFLIEVGRHLKSGTSPFVSDYLFGGHYHLLRDCSFLLWHPVTLLASLLADTPGRFWIMEVMAFFQLMTATAGFALLADFLRRERRLEVSDALLTFYTLSFVYSAFSLTVGSSWINLLGNQSALPWLALGILQTSGRRGAALIALFTLHQILSGYLAASLSNEIVLSLFALGMAFYRRSLVPLGAWIGGQAVALLILAPVLLPAANGFFHSARATGVSLGMQTSFAMPARLFPFSFLLGNYAELLPFFPNDPVYHTLVFPRLPALLGCAAAWCLIPALFQRARWDFLQLLSIGLAGLLALVIIRPAWVGEVMLHTPLLRSMRWPFREILQFQFFVHLVLVLRPVSRAGPSAPLVAAFSFVLFLLPLPFTAAPTLNLLAPDRQMLFSGRTNLFWARVRTRLGPGDEIATVLDLELWQKNWQRIPYSLIGTGNFPAYLRIVSVSGYSTTAPRDQLPLQIAPLYSLGAFSPAQMGAVERERPGVKFIVLESVQPLKIVLISSAAPPLDVTPCLPP